MAHDFKLFPELTNSQMEVYYFDSPHKQIMEDFRAKVVKVIDGDTIRVEVDFRDFDFPIRFRDIAAPEKDEAGGIRAKEWLADKILGLEVDILVNPKVRVGKWGRLLGSVFAQGVDVGEEMIRRGLSVAWDDRKEGQLPSFERELENNDFTQNI